MKKNIYKLLDEAAEQYVPDNFDSIMDEIEKMPTAETPDVYSFNARQPSIGNMLLRQLVFAP